MTDFNPWADAESMLRWQISLARKSVAENRQRLSEAGEIYQLPKPKPGSKPHGLPEQWAFGNLTPHQLSLSGAMRTLQWAGHEVDKAEAALLEGKLPAAIHWIIAANQSINSALSRWHSGGAITMWRYVEKNRETQAIKAGSNRATISIDDEKFSMTDLARSLAAKTDRLGDPIPAKELWAELLGLLDNRGASPKETYDEKYCCPVVKFISRYEDGGSKEVYDSYKFTSFSATVSKLRNKKN